MVFINTLSREQSKAFDTAMREQEDSRKPKKNPPIYHDMQREVNRMVERDPKLRRFKKW